MTQLELGAYVNSHLGERGIEVVLSGGGSVSLYSDNKYLSRDLDFVNVYSINARRIRNAMREIGFIEQSRYFRHPDSQFIIEFPPGPLAIGEEPVKQILERRLSTGVLRVISPTDCIKDRLAAYYFWGDRQCLQQAVLVAQNNQIDMKEIRRWSRAEDQLAEFERIEPLLARKE